MKKEEIIELNGQEYTATLNRESYVKIDEAVNLKKCEKLLQNGPQLYKYKDEEELPDDYNPFAEEIDFDKIDDKIEKYNKTIEEFYVRGLHILLYPKHQLKISQVREMFKSYLDDEEKLFELSEKYGKLLGKCVQIKAEYDEERKNLKAQASKK